MFTVEMEVKNRNSHNAEFYVPATNDFKKYPRSIEGISKAIVLLCKNLNNEQMDIVDFNITVYKGKVYHYTKDKTVIMKLDKQLNQISQ